MDWDRFDALACRVAAGKTRRTLLTGLAGLALAGAGFTEETPARKRRKKKRNTPIVCYGTSACAPTASGTDRDDCNYAGSTVFAGVNAAGSGFRRGNFRGAVMDGANLQGTKFLNATLREASMRGVDLRGAGLNGACLLDTDLLNARIEGPIFARAFVCGTILPNGEIANRDCANLPSCCLA